jgi:hypothetical protein
VLRPDGVFVVSTPDRDVYSPSDSPANPFHVRELTFAEFEEALRQHFAHVDCLLQRPMLGSALLPSKGAVAAAPALTFERRGDEHFEGSVGLPRAVYAVALASAHPVSLPAACLYIESSTAGLRLYGSEAENRIVEARSDNERLEGLLADERTERERLSTDNQRMEDLLGKVLEMDLTDLKAALVRTEAAREKAVRSAAEAAWRLNQVEISTSWRLLAPIRQLGRLLPMLPRLLRRLTGS